MRWITREGAKVDRVACPWLIQRFIDPQAEFYYVPKDKVFEEARRLGATPFDVEGADLGHHGPDCSFETIIKRYGLTDPALHRLAKIVHGADTKDPNPVPEASGLRAIAEGMALTVADDREKLAQAFPIYDALYAWCKASPAGP
ncbi:MAG: chromate resistance protein [Euryarchaeota archaeon]|nr:chromate resistance protein [Euryarchaeota archaeon]